MKRITCLVVLALLGWSLAWAAPYVDPDLSAARPGVELVGGTAESQKPGVFATFKKRLVDTWNSNGYDIYVPFYAWHNRLAYNSVSKYNEYPWGGGIGRSIKDEDGDLHALYAMGFMDSNNRFEPFIGYAFVKNFYLDDARNWALGVGYTLGITARHEYNYIPLPLPLPIVSLEYKDISIQAAYIPGGRNDGNVLFCWLRWHFD